MCYRERSWRNLATVATRYARESVCAKRNRKKREPCCRRRSRTPPDDANIDLNARPWQAPRKSEEAVRDTPPPSHTHFHFEQALRKTMHNCGLLLSRLKRIQSFNWENGSQDQTFPSRRVISVKASPVLPAKPQTISLFNRRTSMALQRSCWISYFKVLQVNRS